jgi:dihydropteroate synthase
MDVRDDAQVARVLPVIQRLVTELGDAIPISIDTRSAVVAAAALGVGARLINDVSAGSDPGMFACVARAGAGLVLMHMQGTPRTMQDRPTYGNVVAEVRDFLVARARAAEDAGIPRSHIAIDPGIGFGKTRAHNLDLIACLGDMVETGYPVMLGTSRKRFMGAICAETEFAELVGATCATTAMGVLAGVRLFRVHDVKANRQAADVAWACRVAYEESRP